MDIKTSLASTMSQMTASNRRPSNEEIATRAYEIFLSRGATDGNDLGDWLEAEQELTTKLNSTLRRTATA